MQHLTHLFFSFFCIIVALYPLDANAQKKFSQSVALQYQKSSTKKRSEILKRLATTPPSVASFRIAVSALTGRSPAIWKQGLQAIEAQSKRYPRAFSRWLCPEPKTTDPTPREQRLSQRSRTRLIWLWDQIIRHAPESASLQTILTLYAHGRKCASRTIPRLIQLSCLYSADTKNPPENHPCTTHSHETHETAKDTLRSLIVHAPHIARRILRKPASRTASLFIHWLQEQTLPRTFQKEVFLTLSKQVVIATKETQADYFKVLLQYSHSPDALAKFARPLIQQADAYVLGRFHKHKHSVVSWNKLLVPLRKRLVQTKEQYTLLALLAITAKAKQQGASLFPVVRRWLTHKQPGVRKQALQTLAAIQPSANMLLPIVIASYASKRHSTGCVALPILSRYLPTSNKIKALFTRELHKPSNPCFGILVKALQPHGKKAAHFAASLRNVFAKQHPANQILTLHTLRFITPKASRHQRFLQTLYTQQKRLPARVLFVVIKQTHANKQALQVFFKQLRHQWKHRENQVRLKSIELVFLHAQMTPKHLLELAHMFSYPERYKAPSSRSSYGLGSRLGRINVYGLSSWWASSLRGKLLRIIRTRTKEVRTASLAILKHPTRYSQNSPWRSFSRQKEAMMWSLWEVLTVLGRRLSPGGQIVSEMSKHAPSDLRWHIRYFAFASRPSLALLRPLIKTASSGNRLKLFALFGPVPKTRRRLIHFFWSAIRWYKRGNHARDAQKEKNAILLPINKIFENTTRFPMQQTDAFFRQLAKQKQSKAAIQLGMALACRQWGNRYCFAWIKRAMTSPFHALHRAAYRQIKRLGKRALPLLGLLQRHARTFSDTSRCEIALRKRISQLKWLQATKGADKAIDKQLLLLKNLPRLR